MEQSIKKKTNIIYRRSVRGNPVALLSLLIVLFTTTFNTACRKDNRIEIQHSDTALQLINSGFYWDQTSQVYHACYWLDGKIHELPEPSGKGAYAYGIDAKDRDIYIAGSYESEDELRLFPPIGKTVRKWSFLILHSGISKNVERRTSFYGMEKFTSPEWLICGPCSG